MKEACRKKRTSLGRECAAYGCSNTFYNLDGSPSSLHFFKFPGTKSKRVVWCNLIKRTDGMDGFCITNATCLCEKHFKDSDIKRNPNRWSLKPGSAPSLHLYGKSLPKPSRKSPAMRVDLTSATLSSNSSNNFEHLHEVEESFSDFASSTTSTSVSIQTEFSFVNSATYFPLLDANQSDCGVDVTCSENAHTKNELFDICTEYEKMSSTVASLEKKAFDLEQQLMQLRKSLFSIEKLEKDESAVRFYTGFPNFASLHAVFEYFEPKLDHIHYWRGPTSAYIADLHYQQTSSSSKPGPLRTLSHLEEFVLVLMRLRVGLFLNDIADRFGISVGHASKIFTTWINFLFHELPLLFPFPSQECVRRDMPD